MMSALGREALHGRLPAAGPHCRRGRHPRAARVAAAAAHRERELEPRFYSQEELQSGFPWPAELHQQQAASQRQAQPLGVDGSPEPDARSAPQPLQPEHQPPEKWRMHPPSHDAARPWALAPGGPAFGGVSRAHTCAAATVVLEPESQPCAAAAPPETLTPQHQQPPLANPEPSAAPLTAAAGAPAEARNHDHSDGDWLQRTRLLVGDDGLARLAATHVLLVGLGGVGSYAAEFLVRAGVGALTIVDGDCVDTTNRNRQLPALRSTVGQPKAEVVAARLRDINPGVRLTVLQEFLDPERARALVGAQRYDFVVDCIDSIAPKQHLLLAAVEAGVRAVSSMGAGGRVDPSRVRTADLQDTYGDPFAANIRRGLRKKGVGRGVVAVFSDEPVKRASLALTDQTYKKSYYGTISYLPALFGLWISQHVIREALQEPGYRVPKQPPPSRAGAAASGGAAGKCAARGQDGGGEQREGKRRRGERGVLFASIRRGATGAGMGYDGSGI